MKKMKAIINKINRSKLGNFLFTIGVIFVTVTSCTKDYENINTNQYETTTKQQEADNYISGRNFVDMINAVTPAGDQAGKSNFVGRYQLSFNLAGDCYSGYMAQAGDWGGNTNNLTYGFNLGWVNEQFLLNGRLMSAWKNVKDITTITGDKLQFEVAEVIKVTGVIRTTDSYGPIPYSKIPTGTTTPAFDSQESIYYSAIEDLVKARNILYQTGGGAGKPLSKFDLIYAGDYLKWAKYANSLILRLAMRIVYVDPSKAKLYAEEAVSNPAGLLTVASDGAKYSIKPGNGDFYYSNPLKLMTSTYLETRAGASMVSILSGYKDPRLAVYFKNSTLPGHTFEVVGIRSGINVIRSSYQPFSELNVTYDTPLPWMLASEVYFLRAEGAIRGWNMAGDAKGLYENGIQVAFEESVVSMPNGYLTNNTLMPANYVDPAISDNNAQAVSTITIQWDSTVSFEKQLERIITQKWISMYPNGQEAWSEFRRTGYPKIFPVVVNKSGGLVNTKIQVRRLPYPSAQYAQNGEQVSNALTLLGGPDNGGTKLWWDKK